MVAAKDAADPDDECEPANAKCANDECILLDPLSPDTSLLYTKTSPSHPCGDRMPQIGQPLVGEQLQCLLEWIQANAEPE